MVSSTQLLECSSLLGVSSSGHAPLESHLSVSPPSTKLTELTYPLKQHSRVFKSSSIAAKTQAIAEPNNTLGTARKIGTLSGERTFKDSLGINDTQDFYRFSLSSIRNFSLSLNGLTADADVELIRDANNNGVVDDGEVIKVSALSGTQPASMLLHPLAAGTYYVRVYQFNGSTNYNLNLSATAVVENKLGTAQNIGTLSGSRTFKGFVGSSDTQVFYRFSLNTISNLNLSLKGLSADADVQLIRDANNNGVVDYRSEALDVSALSGTQPESMLIDPLAAGTYYIRVYQSSGNTNYNLRLSATAVVDNTLGTALNIGTLRSERTFKNFVGSTDTQDFYRFSLSTISNLNLSLKGLSTDANVQLIRDTNTNGVVNDGEVIKVSAFSDTKAESMLIDPLAAGTYYVRVYQSKGNTNYNLSLSATAVVDNTLDTAQNIGTLSGERTFKGFVGSSDTQDFYRFSLNTISNLNLSLKGLRADADMQLIRDTNSNGVANDGEVLKFSALSGTLAESIVLDPLAAGIYYVRVYQSSGNTNYNLSLSTTAVVDNALNTARNIGTLSGSRTFKDFVGNTDTQDFYHFSLSAISNLNLALRGLSADANVQLIRDTNTNGVVNGGEAIKVSELYGSKAELISYSGLAAGTYYVRVYQSSGNTNYNLSLSQSPSDGFNSDYGYGLVNAAVAVARALGQRPFPNVPKLGGNKWGLDMVNAPEAWARGYTGQGIVVAVVDTGVDYNHSDLDANIWRNSDEIAGNKLDDDGNGYVDDIRGWDFVDADNDPMDTGTHGTHVAGTIAAENNGSGVTGVAYNASIMPVRVLAAEGDGSDPSIAAGIRYAANNGADVINLSLNDDYDDSNDIKTAIRYATEKGSVVVISTGNSYNSKPGYPALYATQWGIAVGAVDRGKKIADFSNRAGTTRLDYVVAPGVNVYSTTPNNKYQYKDGTSMAAPYVAGVAALMLSAKNSLTPTQVENIVTATANPTGIKI
jgi:subtilisin family serine protease